MAGMFVPQMVPALDPLKALQGIGHNIRQGLDDKQRMEILNKIDPSDPNSLNEASSRLSATGRLDNIYLADRLQQASTKREETLYNRTQAEKDREQQRTTDTSLADIYTSRPGVAPSSAPAARPPAPPSSPPPDADLLEGGGDGARPPAPDLSVRAPGAGAFAVASGGPTPTPAPPDNMISMAPRQATPAPAGVEQLPPPPPRPAGAPQPAPRPDVPPPASPQVAQAAPIPQPRPTVTPQPPAAPAPTVRQPAPVAAPQTPDTASEEAQWFNHIRRIDQALRRSDLTASQKQSLMAERKDSIEEIKRIREPQKEAEKLEAASRKTAMQFDLKTREGLAKQIFMARDQALNADAELDRFEAIVTNPKYRGGPGSWGPEAVQNFLLGANNIAKGLGMKPKDWRLMPQGLVDSYGEMVTEKALLDEAGVLSKALGSRKLDVLKGAHSDKDVKWIQGQVANKDMSTAGALRAIEVQRVLSQRIKDMSAIVRDGLEKGQTHAEIQGRLENFGHKRPMFIGPEGKPTEAGRKLGAGSAGSGAGTTPNKAPAAPAAGGAAPPAAAIKALRDDPQRRDEFDAKYGKGAAGRALGGM